MKKLLMIIAVLFCSLESYEQNAVRQEDSKGMVRDTTQTTRPTTKKAVNKKRSLKKRSHKRKAFPAPQNEIKKPGHHTNMDNNQQR